MFDARSVRAHASTGVIPAKRSAERESSGAFNGRVLGWIPAVAALAGMTNFGGSSLWMQGVGMAGDTGRRRYDARLVRAPAPKGVIPAKRQR
jgi:hypothetical protein